MTTQLRDYTIADGYLEEFVAAWLSGVPPLRAAHGFTLDGPWLVRSERRFIWLLSHPCSEREWVERNAAYYADPLRKALRPDPAQWIESATEHFVESIG